MNNTFTVFLEMLAMTFAVGGFFVVAAMRCAPWGSESNLAVNARFFADEALEEAMRELEATRLAEATLAQQMERPPISFRNALAA